MKKKTTHIHQVIQKMKINHIFILLEMLLYQESIINNKKKNKITHWIIDSGIRINLSFII